MNYFRAHLKAFDGNTRGPNGEDTTIYGPEGTPVPPRFRARDHDDLNPIEWLLIHRLMDPFIQLVCRPIRLLANRLIGKRRRSSDVDQKAVNATVISVIARMVVCMLASLSLAAAIGVLDNIGSQKNRIIVMTVFAQVIASSVQFLGQESTPMYLLIIS